MSFIEMKGLRLGLPAASIWIVLALLCVFLDRDLLSYAAGQAEADTPALSEAETPAIAVDELEFVLAHPVREFDEPGVLNYGGYCTGGAQLVLSQYRYADGGRGQVSVEVVVHPDNYSYVVHDFFGTFWVGINDPLKRTGSIDGPLPVFALRSFSPDGVNEPQHVCAVISPKEDRRSKGTFEGIAGWYEDSGNAITTVMIRFEGLNGIPTTLIDKYLAEHPSSVQNNDSRFENWVAQDIDKWTTLLQTRANEDRILHAATIHLRHHDKRAFGLMELPGKQLEPAAKSAGVDAAVERMKEWLEEREAGPNQNPEP